MINYTAEAIGMAILVPFGDGVVANVLLAHFLLPIPGKRDSDWGYAWIPVVAPWLAERSG